MNSVARRVTTEERLMSRRTSFRQTDVARAIKGAVAARAKVARVELISDGKIVIVLDGARPVDDETPLQRWMREHGQG